MKERTDEDVACLNDHCGHPTCPRCHDHCTKLPCSRDNPKPYTTQVTYDEHPDDGQFYRPDPFRP